METVDSDTAIATARRLMAEEGILAGISSGAAVAAADRLAKLPEFQDKINRRDLYLLHQNVI